MKNVIISVFILTATIDFAQSINSQYHFGGSNVEDCSKIVAAPDGTGYYLVASTASSDGDVINPVYGDLDAWLIKLNNSYQIQWEKSYGGTELDGFSDIIIQNDTLFVVGNSSSGISGNKTIANFGLGDIWLLALDLSGNILWQNAYGGDQKENKAKIISLNNGNLLLSCVSYSEANGNKTTDIIGLSNEPWLLKLNSQNGSIIQQKSIEVAYSPLYQLSGTISIDPFTEELYFLTSTFTGVYGEKTDFGYGMNDLWLAKLDENLDVVSNKCFGGTENDGLSRSIYFTSNAIYLACATNSPSSGNKSSQLNGVVDPMNADYWVIKLSKQLDIVWDKSYGGFENDSPHGFVKGDGNSFMLYGNSNSTASGNKNVPSYGESDGWTLIIDEVNGTILEQNSFGGEVSDVFLSALINANHDVVVVGSSNSGISGNKTVPSYGQSDIWMLELETTAILKVNTLLDEKNAAFYPNPFTENLVIDLKDFDANTTLTIFSLDGKKVHETQLEANSVYVWNTVLEAQVFIYHLTGKEGKTLTGKLVKL